MGTSLTGKALAVPYLASVVAANWATGRYGLIPVGAGLLATAGTPLIGVTILVRDFLQDAAGRYAILALIACAAALSAAVSPRQIAFASGATLAIAETMEWAVYTPLRRRCGWGSARWGGVVLAANAAGSLADTLIFLSLAGFPLAAADVAGQMAGKMYVTVAAVLAGVLIRAALVPDNPVVAAGPAGDEARPHRGDPDSVRREAP